MIRGEFLKSSLITGFAAFVYYPNEHRWQVDSINDHSHWKTNNS